MRKIDHIGIAVQDIDQALEFYQGALDLGHVEVEEVRDQKVRVAILHVGESRIELLQPTSPDGPVGRFIEKRGEGIHHLSLEVEDIEQALARLRAAGASLIDEQPRIGAGGRRIAFVHPRSAHGVLIELAEQPSE